jgi:hypothetical protein
MQPDIADQLMQNLLAFFELAIKYDGKRTSGTTPKKRPSYGVVDHSNPRINRASD